jgi:hypothetical protein
MAVKRSPAQGGVDAPPLRPAPPRPQPIPGSKSASPVAPDEGPGKQRPAP